MTKEEFTFALLSGFAGYNGLAILRALHEFSYVQNVFLEPTEIKSTGLFWVSKEFTINNKQFESGDCIDMNSIKCAR